MTFDISILIVNYNSQFFVKECIESIIVQQTKASVQLIISDDYSNDKSIQIIKECLKEPIYWLKDVQVAENKSNIGCYCNMLSGLKLCTGKYIAYLEGDDYWSSPTKLQDQWEFLEANPQYNGIGTGCKFINETGETIDQKWYMLDEHKTLNNRDLWAFPPFQTSTFMFRKSALPILPNYFKKTTTNDKILFALLTLNKPIYYNPEKTTNYRFHEDNITSKSSTLANTLYRPIYTNVLLLRYVGLKGIRGFTTSLVKFIINALRIAFNRAKGTLKQ